jgi:hypothetical protein
MSSVRWTAEDLARHNAKQDRLREGVKVIVGERKAENKFHATPTVSNSIRFASKGEAALYDRLRMLESAGLIHYFLRQVPFHLPGNIVYRADFMVVMNDRFHKNGVTRYLDFKGGPLHPIFVLKRKQVEELYPVKIEVVTRKKGGFIGL